MGSVMEYSDMQILQMIGRAGRPQVNLHYMLENSVIMHKSDNFI